MPRTGTKRSDINNEDVRTHINVIGRYFINSPAKPGQKINGRNAAKVVAVEEGTGKNEGVLGALVVEGEDDGKFFHVNVGSGLTDENREQIWESRDAVIGQLVEVRADAATQSQDAEDTWSLRFPRFKTFRGFEPGEKL